MEDAEQIFSDERESAISYILQKLLLAPKQIKFPQKNSLFNTRCTVQKKICDVIIDEGSTKIIMSKDLVKSLGLTTSQYPTPYKIRQVGKGNEVRV